MEFAVRMTCQDCVADIKRVLSGHSGNIMIEYYIHMPDSVLCIVVVLAVLCAVCAGIDEVFVNLENEFVLVKTSLPSSSVKELLESTGKLVIFRGYGGASDGEIYILNT